MALSEETLFDERTGRIMNPSLAEYYVPVNLDVPHIEIIYNNIPDEHNPLGAHVIGENCRLRSINCRKKMNSETAGFLPIMFFLRFFIDLINKTNE